MNDSIKAVLLQQLKRHEGLRLKPYRCTEGKLTIGYGRNLDDVGVTDTEAEQLLLHDVDDVLAKLQRLPTFCELDEARQAIIANMCFQLGFAGVMQFRKMWAALAGRDYSMAAIQMLDSRWAKQTPNRARELAKLMREGGGDA